MTTTQIQNTDRLNGINVPVLKKLFAEVRENPRKGATTWTAATRWVTGAVTETDVHGYEIGGRKIARSFRFRTDEPHEIAGTNTYANPQEYLLGAFNACIVVGYVAMATMYGIEVESVEVETTGDIDLRGFFGLSKDVKPGYDTLHYTVHIKGNGTEAEFREIHEIVSARSPNRFNLSQPINLVSELIIN